MPISMAILAAISLLLQFFSHTMLQTLAIHAVAVVLIGVLGCDTLPMMAIRDPTTILLQGATHDTLPTLAICAIAMLLL